MKNRRQRKPEETGTGGLKKLRLFLASAGGEDFDTLHTLAACLVGEGTGCQYTLSFLETTRQIRGSGLVPLSAMRSVSRTTC
jgi:hypothetical protein